MVIKKEGTAAFSFSLVENPDALGDNEKGIVWLDFFLEGEKITVESKGTTITAVLNQNTDREFQIFQTGITPRLDQDNEVIVSWAPTMFLLHVNGKILQKLDPSSFD